LCWGPAITCAKTASGRWSSACRAGRLVLVAVIAADALGPSSVHGVSLPSRYTSDNSNEDAAELAATLGIDYRTISIEPAHRAMMSMLAPDFGLDKAPAPEQGSGLAEENLQSRLRGVVLMALSNKFGWLVLTTGNKSELAVGYSTLYGDTAGGFAAIKDVPKPWSTAFAGGATRPPRWYRSGCSPNRPPRSFARASWTRTACRPTSTSTLSWRRTWKAISLRPNWWKLFCPGPGGAGGALGGHRRVQTPPEPDRGPGNAQGFRAGPAHAHHQRVPLTHMGPGQGAPPRR